MTTTADRRVVVTYDGTAIRIAIYERAVLLADAIITRERALDLAADLLAPVRRLPRPTHATDSSIQ
jgi:hypothetical protein